MSKLTWCGVVVALSWVLLIGHASYVYQLSWEEQYQQYGYSCAGNPPRYPNWMASESLRDFPFVTTDSRAEITNYYYRSDPRFINPMIRPQSLSCMTTAYLKMYDYGFFRIVTLDYMTINWGISR